MGPVFVERMIRELDHPRDGGDQTPRGLLGNDVGLRPGVGRTHESERGAADSVHRDEFPVHLVAMQADHVEPARAAALDPIEHAGQVGGDGDVVFEDQRHRIRAVRNHLLRLTVAEPTAHRSG